MVMPGFPAIGGPGFGGYQGGSAESRGLSSIDSKKYSYANKDFVRNMQRLNQATDYMAAMMQTMQKGIDEANRNIIEEIQGFAGDLFVLFAGLEPTGIDIGDLKYIIQGIGALLGIQPDTPFPLNLVEAAWHFFNTYIVPFDQFTDVLFDAILAWAEEFGLSEEFVNAIKEFKEAVEGLFGSLDGFIDIFSDLLDALGIVGLDLDSFADLFANIVEVAVGILNNPLVGNILDWITTFLVPFINMVTDFINAFNPSSWVSAGQIAQEGANISPPVIASTALWNVSGDADSGWVFDDTQSSDSTTGSFKTNANGTAKEIRSQKYFDCAPGDKFNIKGQLRWSGVPTGSNAFGIGVKLYNNETFIQNLTIPIPGGHGASGGWTEVSSQLTIPSSPDINKFKVIGYVDTGFNTGQVWVDAISVKKLGKISTSIIDNLFGFIQDFLANFPIPFLSIGSIGNAQPELLVESSFTGTDSFIPGSGWEHDASVGRTNLGSAKVTPAGQVRELVSIDIPVSEGQKFSESVWIRWASIAITGGSTNHCTLAFKEYDSSGTHIGTAVIDSRTLTAGTQTTWQQLSGSYTVPAGVTKVKVRLMVTANVTAGSIWWDDASAKKTGLLQLAWVDGLVDIVQGFLNAFGLSAIADLLEGDITDIWANIISTIINPLGLITQVGAPIVQNLIDILFNSWASGNPTETTGNTLTDLFNMALSVLGIGSQAQAQNVVQDIQIGQLLDPGSGGFSYDFTGAAVSTMPAADWDVQALSGAAGQPGLSGTGTMKAYTFGGSPREHVLRYKGGSVNETATDTQLIMFNMMSDVRSDVTSTPGLALCGRVTNASLATLANQYWVEGRIERNYVYIQVMAGGTYTILGSVVPYTENTSGVWKLKLGTTSSNREFLLYHNDSLIVGRTDSTAISSMGANYRRGGMVTRIGNAFTGFSTIQVPFPEVGSWGASDRGAAA